MDELDIHAVAARIRARYGLKSQPALARFLGASEKTVANWLHGRNYPDEHYAALLAQHAQVDADAMIAYCHALRQTDPEGRERWLRITRRLLAGEKFSVGRATVFVADGALPN